MKKYIFLLIFLIAAAPAIAQKTTVAPYPSGEEEGEDTPGWEYFMKKSKKEQKKSKSDDTKSDALNKEIIEEKEWKQDGFLLGLGPMFAVNGSINTLSTDGYKNRPEFGIGNFGASILMLPVNKFGLILNVSKNSIALSQYVHDNSDYEITANLDYINVMPALYLGGFYLGYNYGIHTGGVQEYSKEYGYKDSDIEENENFNLGEICIGGMIPLTDTRTGRFNLLLEASYQIENFKEVDDVQPFTFSIGFSYIFNVVK